MRSPDSRGWIAEGDLPPEKYRVMRERLDAFRCDKETAVRTSMANKELVRSMGW